MSAKKKRVPKAGAVWRMSAEEATLAKKPHYNAYACGHGAHGGAKYNRAKAKRAWKKQLEQEGAPRGSFLFRRQTRANINMPKAETTMLPSSKPVLRYPKTIKITALAK